MVPLRKEWPYLFAATASVEAIGVQSGQSSTK